jgi:phage terminase large subunit
MPPKHWAILSSGARYRGLFGGRGAGKSREIAGKLLMDSFEVTGTLLCARQFQNATQDSSKGLLEKLIAEHELSGSFAITNANIINRQSGGKFVFVGLERNINSIRSMPDIARVWLEEASDVSEPALRVLWPTIRDRDSVIYVSWNPGDPTDPIDEFFRKHPRRDMCSAHVNFEDNPWFGATSMPAEMEALRAHNYERYRHVWLGVYEADKDSKVFGAGTYRVGYPVGRTMGQIVYGADLGSRRDPTAGCKVIFYPDTKELYVAREIYQRGVPIQFVPELFDKLLPDRNTLLTIDGSWPQSIEVLRGVGFNLHEANRGPGSIKDGIDFLFEHKLVIDPSCEFLIKELNSYSWPTSRLTGKIVSTKKPVGSDDHVIDSLRYATETLNPNLLLSGEEEGPPDGGVIWLPLARTSPSFRRDTLPWHLR